MDEGQVPRKVCVITGARSEYGYLKPLMEAISRSDELELQVMVTGLHLSDHWGSGIELIEGDGFSITEVVDMHVPFENTGLAMAHSLSDGVRGFADAFQRCKPDIIAFLGDRVEPLAATLAATYMRIPIAHVQGGDTSSGKHVDNNVRHCMTKLSHLHFTATERSKDVVLRMGEEPDKVFHTGVLSLDPVISGTTLSNEEVHGRVGLSPEGRTIIVLHHANTGEEGRAAHQIETILEAVAARLEKDPMSQAILIYPNLDPGGSRIIDHIDQWGSRHGPRVKVVPSLPHIEFLSLLAHGAVLVGNSSCGVIEAPFFRIPVVNIGLRQEGREAAPLVIQVSEVSIDIISRAIDHALDDTGYREVMAASIHPYMNPDGRTSSEAIVEVLERVELGDTILQKRISYMDDFRDACVMFR